VGQTLSSVNPSQRHPYGFHAGVQIADVPRYALAPRGIETAPCLALETGARAGDGAVYFGGVEIQDCAEEFAGGSASLWGSLASCAPVAYRRW
jgi:hypothetical protein